MARIRTVKPEFWASEQVMACSRGARLLFIGIWNFADDAGRIPNSPKSIKAQVFPGDDDLDSETIRRMLDELSSSGLIRLYEAEGREYLYVTGWHHQKIDRPRPSKYPQPPIGEASTNARRALATDLILSNPIRSEAGAGTAGKSPEAKQGTAVSLASALPTGALASQPTGRPKPKAVTELTRTELDAHYHRHTYADLTKPPLCEHGCCVGWPSMRKAS